MAAADKPDDRYASRQCRYDAAQAVLDDQTPIGPNTLLLGGVEKQVRRGFTSGYHRGCVDVGLKMRQEPGRCEGVLDSGERAVRGDASFQLERRDDISRDLVL